MLQHLEGNMLETLALTLKNVEQCWKCTSPAFDTHIAHICWQDIFSQMRFCWQLQIKLFHIDRFFHENSTLVLQSVTYRLTSAWDFTKVGGIWTGVRVSFMRVWLPSSNWFVIFLQGSIWRLFHGWRIACFFWRCYLLHVACDGEEVYV